MSSRIPSLTEKKPKVGEAAAGAAATGSEPDCVDIMDIIKSRAKAEKEEELILASTNREEEEEENDSPSQTTKVTGNKTQQENKQKTQLRSKATPTSGVESFPTVNSDDDEFDILDVVRQRTNGIMINHDEVKNEKEIEKSKARKVKQVTNNNKKDNIHSTNTNREKQSDNEKHKLLCKESSDFDIMHVVQERAMAATTTLAPKKNKEDDDNDGIIVSSSAYRQRRRISQTYALDDEESNKNDNSAAVLAAQQQKSPVPVAAVQQQPGAYSGAPGVSLQRLDNIRFSLVGVEGGEGGLGDFKDDQAISQRAVDAPEPEGVGGGLPPNNTECTNDEMANNNKQREQLAEATPVMEEDEDLPNPDIEAQPFDMEAAEQRKSIEEKKIHRMKFCFFASLLIAAVILFGALYGRYYGSGSDSSSKNDLVPTTIPSIAPSEVPSSAPSGTFDLLMLHNLTNYTLQQLENYSTPQWKALDWLSRHPHITDMEEWGKKQLFALATFYYSMDGDNWPQEIKSRWLRYDTHECFWYSSLYGHILENKKYIDWDFNVGASICNQDNKLITILRISDLKLAGYNPFIPLEISLLADTITEIGLAMNNIDGDIADFLPMTLYEMEKLTKLSLFDNRFDGHLPSELGLMTAIQDLVLSFNSLTGSIPSELGLMAAIQDLDLYNNSLTGQLPSELGLLTSLSKLYLYENSLTGSIPRELERLTNLTTLYLQNNGLTGTIPKELESLVENGSLVRLKLASNSFSGTIPEGLCSLGLFNTDVEIFGLGLSFDCNDMLCGCCWCPCPGSNYSSYCQTHPVYIHEPGWPGTFPAPVNRSNAITINIRTDSYPNETSFAWAVKNETGSWNETGGWESLEYHTTTDANSIHSYTFEVVSNSTYKLRLVDWYGDGTCCEHGYGWFTITNSTPSLDHLDGTVIWHTSGDVFHIRPRGEPSLFDVFIWVDENGHARLANST